MSCLDQWRYELLSYRKGSAGRDLPMLDFTSLLGPPEVRVVRLSLGTRPQEGRGSPQEPKPPRPPRQAVSPLRIRPRRKKKSKKSQTSTDLDDNRLPMSITLGRALGAQVQPLMAVLMSPRVRTTSFDSDSDDGERSEEEDDDVKTSAKGKAPLLSITSLELPDLAPPRKPPCQPVRRVRTSVLRSRPPHPHRACAQTTPAQTITCAGLALTTPAPATRN